MPNERRLSVMRKFDDYGDDRIFERRLESAQKWRERIKRENREIAQKGENECVPLSLEVKIRLGLGKIDQFLKNLG